MAAAATDPIIATRTKLADTTMMMMLIP
jgi:hypothetical protein